MKATIRWSNLSEDYENVAVVSKVRVDGRQVFVDCGGLGEVEYELAGEPVKDGEDFDREWPIDPGDRRLVDEWCLDALGVGLSEPGT